MILHFEKNDRKRER